MTDFRPMKLILTYDVISETTQEYFQFVMGQYVPSMQTMGLQIFEAWQTVYGDAPSRLITFVSEDKATMMGLLRDERWETLNDQLEQFVTNFSYKVIPYREAFQL